VISTLLWRCPCCQSDDALRHKTYWFRNDEVECQACRTAWEVQRIIGQDYRLTVIRGDPVSIGRGRWLADWYDLMKAGLRLTPKPNVALPLEPGEECYLQSRVAYMFAEKDNPVYGLWTREEAPWEAEKNPGLSFMKKWAAGCLWLTSERFVWTSGRRTLTFRLKRVNAAYAQGNRFFAIIYGHRLYKLKFRQESILKWVTYTALVAKRVEQVADHRIAVSNY
jgi:hypothetical protein